MGKKINEIENFNIVEDLKDEQFAKEVAARKTSNKNFDVDMQRDKSVGTPIGTRVRLTGKVEVNHKWNANMIGSAVEAKILLEDVEVDTMWISVNALIPQLNFNNYLVNGQCQQQWSGKTTAKAAESATTPVDDGTPVTWASDLEDITNYGDIAAAWAGYIPVRTEFKLAFIWSKHPEILEGLELVYRGTIGRESVANRVYQFGTTDDNKPKFISAGCKRANTQKVWEIA